MKEMSQETTLPAFSVVDFEVHAVYGVHFENPSDNDLKEKWDEWFESKKRGDSPLVREGWTPIYRDHCNTITTYLKTPDWCNNIEVEHPKLFGSQSSLNMKVSRSLTVREDGAAAVTIRLQANDKEKEYKLDDILASLQLAPRIRIGKKLHKNYDNVYVQSSEEMATTSSEVYRFMADDHKTLSDTILIEHKIIDNLAKKDDHPLAEDKSPLFKLFLGALKQIVSEKPNPVWSEFCNIRSIRKEFKDKGYLSNELFPWMGDSQIPYFVVFVTIPDSIYKEAFLETGAETQSRNKKKQSRQQYTRTLAAILLRWLSPKNAEYISIDFLQSLKLLDEDGIFVNQYMNSLSFVTYSSIGTLCIMPERDWKKRDEKLDPQEATYGSILRCVELSRLRWHHAYRLNRSLDKLIKDVVDYCGVKGFERFLEELLDLRAEAALHFLNPLTYHWDATVGADIANFLQVDVIEDIENESLRKLEMVKELIHEKLDVLRAKVMRGTLQPE